MADISEININDIPYSIKDTQARSTINSVSTNLENYLPLSGGSLTGSLTTSLQTIVKDDRIDTNNPPESNQWPKHFVIKDKDNEPRGYFELYQYADGTQGIQVETRRKVNNETLYNCLRLAIKEDGERVVNISTAAIPAWQDALQVLPLSGGTITGMLEIQDNSIHIKRSNADISASSISNNQYAIIGMTDVNDRLMGYIQGVNYTNGGTRIQLSARKYINNANVDNSLYLSINASGTKTVSVSDSEIWRNALGASNGIWPISLGGTDATAITGSDGAVHNLFPNNLGTSIGYLAGLTQNWASTGYTKLPLSVGLGGSGQNSITQTTGSRNTTNTTAGTINIYKWGKVVTIQSYNTLKLTEALASHKSRAIGSIGSAYYPNYSMIAWAGNASYPGVIYLNTSGTITLYNTGSVSIPADSTIHFTVTYIIE